MTSFNRSREHSDFPGPIFVLGFSNLSVVVILSFGYSLFCEYDRLYCPVGVELHFLYAHLSVVIVKEA